MFGMYLVRLCFDPTELLSCLNVFDVQSFRFASIFRVSRVVSSLFIF